MGTITVSALPQPPYGQQEAPSPHLPGVSATVHLDLITVAKGRFEGDLALSFSRPFPSSENSPREGHRPTARTLTDRQ